MKKQVLSAVLACLLTASAFSFTGCEDAELKKVVDQNAANAESALQDAASKSDAAIKSAAEKAAKDLADAKAALEKAIADKASAGDIAAAVEKLNKAVENAGKAAADADAALKSSLEAAQSEANKAMAEDLKTLKNELNGSIDTARSDMEKALAQDLKDLKAELEKLIQKNDESASSLVEKTKNELLDEIAKLNDLYKKLDASMQENAGLKDSIEALKKETQEAIETVKKAAFKLEEWNAATDKLLAEGFKALDAAYDAYAKKADVWALYTDEEKALFDSLKRDAYIRLLRAPTTAVLDEVIADLQEEYKAIPNAFVKTQNLIADVEKMIAEIEAYVKVEGQSINDKAARDMIKAANDKLAVAGVALEVARPVYTGADASKEDKKAFTDLETKYNNLKKTMAKYNEAVGQAALLEEGSALEKDMAALNATLITADSKKAIADIADRYNKWNDKVVTWNSDASHVEKQVVVPGLNDGKNATLTAFEACQARWALLDNTKDHFGAAYQAAVDINKAIKAVGDELTAKGPSKELYSKIDQLEKKTIPGWINTYFKAPYDKELPSEGFAGSVNYNLVNHQAMKDVHAAYDKSIESYMNAAQAFLDAAAVIRDKNFTVDLLSYTEVYAAYDAYQNWVKAEDLGLTDLGGQSSALKAARADVLRIYAEYETLRTNAFNAYQMLANNAQAAGLLKTEVVTVKEAVKDAKGNVVTPAVTLEVPVVDANGNMIFDLSKLDNANPEHRAVAQELAAWFDTYAVTKTENKKTVLVFERGANVGYALNDVLCVSDFDFNEWYSDTKVVVGEDLYKIIATMNTALDLMDYKDQKLADLNELYYAERGHIQNSGLTAEAQNNAVFMANEAARLGAERIQAADNKVSVDNAFNMAQESLKDWLISYQEAAEAELKKVYDQKLADIKASGLSDAQKAAATEKVQTPYDAALTEIKAALEVPTITAAVDTAKAAMDQWFTVNGLDTAVVPVVAYDNVFNVLAGKEGKGHFGSNGDSSTFSEDVQVTTAEADHLKVWGWAGFAAEKPDFKFGYVVDGKVLTMSTGFVFETEKEVIDFAASKGAKSASRYAIMVDLAGMSGTGVHTITPVVMVGDSIYEMCPTFNVTVTAPAKA